MTTQTLAAMPLSFHVVPRRYAPIVFGLIMSTVICAVTSSMITSINTGFDGNYVSRWLRAYALAWSFASRRSLCSGRTFGAWWSV